MAGFWDYFEAAGMKTLVYEICCDWLLVVGIWFGYEGCC